MATKSDIIDAAREAEAIHPDQIFQLLKEHISIESGKVIVEIDDFKLSATEAVEWMRNQPERYGNLFKPASTPGIGGDSGAGATHRTAPDVNTISPADYRRLRS